MFESCLSSAMLNSWKLLIRMFGSTGVTGDWNSVKSSSKSSPFQKKAWNSDAPGARYMLVISCE